MWAHEVSEVGVMTGTHAGLCLPDVCSALTVLSATPRSSFSLSSLVPTLHESLFHTHSLPLFLLLTGPLKNRAVFM